MEREIEAEGAVLTAENRRIEAELTDLDRSWLNRKLHQYGMVPEQGVDHFKKIVAGKQLWNYDNLEPNEKKLIL